MVLPERIELSTSPLPRGCSTAELQQRRTPKRLIRLQTQPEERKGPGAEQSINQREDTASRDTRLTRMFHGCSLASGLPADRSWTAFPIRPAHRLAVALNLGRLRLNACVHRRAEETHRLTCVAIIQKHLKTSYPRNLLRNAVGRFRCHQLAQFRPGSLEQAYVTIHL